MFLLSIIIPHYNDPHSLERLLQSIPQCDEIQVIVVDDKSTVNTDGIEQQIISRVGGVFLHNTTPCKSAGTCRNLGLQRALGQWLVFADADDYFVKGAFDVIKAHVDSDANIVYFSPTSNDIDAECAGTRHKKYDKMVRQFVECPNEGNELTLRCKFVVPWSKMICNRFVQENHILFDEVPASNDEMFSVKTAFRADKIEAFTEQIYCVTQSKHSLTTLKNEANYWARVEVFQQRQKFIQEYVDLEKYPYLEPMGLGIIWRGFRQGYKLRFLLRIYRHFKRERVVIIPRRKLIYYIVHYLDVFIYSCEAN